MKSLLFFVCTVLLLGLLAAGGITKAPVPTAITLVRLPGPLINFTTTTTPSLTDPALVGPWLLKTGMKNNETLSVISEEEPTITFSSDGTFTVFGGCTYYKGDYFLTGQTTESRKTIILGPVSLISQGVPLITFDTDGSFALFKGCTCYKENRILTGQVTDFRKPIRLRPVPQAAAFCARMNSTETNYLRILQAAETYSIRNNIEYMNLRTAAGEQLFYRSGNL